MAKTYNEIKNSVLGKKYDINKNSEKAEKTYDEIKTGVKNGKYNFNLVKSELENEIRFDTFASDLSSVSKTIVDTRNNWQTQETMQNTRSSIESMQGRLSAYKEYQRLFGGKDSANGIKEIEKLQDDMRQTLDGWEDISKHYGKYENADAYINALKIAQKQAKEYEKMKTSDLGKMKTEITDLESVLGTVKEHESNIEWLREAEKWESLTYGGKVKEAENELSEYLKSVGYKSTDEISKLLGEKKVYLNKAQRLQDSVYLSSVGDINSENYDKDFNKYAEKGKALGKEKNAWWEGGYKNSIQNLRDNPEVLKTYEQTSDENGEIINSILDNQIEYLAAKYMTDEEAKIYNYYMGKSDEEGAEKYLKAIEESLKQRQGQAIYEEREGMLSKYTFGYTAGIDQFTQGIINEFNTEDTYIPTTGIQNASGLIREDIKYEHGTLGQIGYDLINTTSNMMPSILTSTVIGTVNPVVGSYVGAGLMGTSAAGNAYQEMLNLGYDKGQARTYSTLVGLSEAGLQRAMGGIGKLGGVSGKLSNVVSGIDNGLAKFAIRWGGSALAEGFEESAQEVLNPLFMNVAAGYDTGAEVDWSEVVYNGLLGALSGGVLEGGNIAVNSYAESSFNKAMGQNIKANERVSEVFDIASNPEVASAYETYTRYANKGINADNISDTKLGRLYSNAKLDAQEVLDSKKSTVEQRESAQNTLDKLNVYSQANVSSRTGSAQNINKSLYKDFNAEDIVNLIESGLESGENTEAHRLATEYKAKVENYDALAEIVTKKMNGEGLTAEETQLLAESKTKLSTKEITSLIDANDVAIKTEETDDITAQLVERGESEEVADIVARKIRGERITLDEAKKLNTSENGLKVFAENVDEDLVGYIETMDSGADVNLFISLYDGKTDAEAYANAFNLTTAYAKNNFSYDTILKNKGVLSAEQVNAIYAETRIKADKEAQNAINKLNEKIADKMSYKGFIDDSAIDYTNTGKGSVNWNNLDSRQKQAVTFMKGVAIATGMNLVIEHNAKSKYNGNYDPSSNTITMDIAKFTDKNGIEKEVIIPAFSHELTHWMKKKAPTLWRETNEVVFSTLLNYYNSNTEQAIKDKIVLLDRLNPEIKHTEEDAEGITVTEEDLIKAEMNRKGKSEDVAREEIIARACEDMLKMSEEGKKMFNSLSESEQKTFIDKVRELIQNLKDWVSELLSSYSSTSKEAQIMRQYEDKLNELSKLWDEMLTESVEVNQSLEKSGQFKHDGNDNTKFSDRDTELRKLDEQYTSALLDGDMKTAQKLVAKAAKAAGYDSPVLYHGTRAFGFTTPDIGRAMDETAFYMSTKPEVSETYSRGAGIREISDKGPKMLTERATTAQVQKALQEFYPSVKAYTSAERTMFDLVTENGRKETVSKEMAIREINDKRKVQAQKGILALVAKTDNFLVINGHGALWNEISIPLRLRENLAESMASYGRVSKKPNTARTVDFVVAAKSLGYDGVIFKNIIDSGAKEAGDSIPASDVYAVFKSADVKSADTVTYDDKGNVIPLSERFNAKKTDIRYSDRDSEGNTLSKAQQAFFKSSKVRDENGNLLVMYRGDSNEFTVFDRKKTNYSNLYGRDFYFTKSKAHAEQYGASREFYLDIKNPLSPKQNVITKKQMLNFLKAIENDGADYDLYNYGQEATAESVLQSVWGKGDFEMLQDVSAGAIGDLVAAVELFNEVNGTSYDGIVLPTETVTFNSEQAKLTSNLKPTEDEDIRFSMRENVEETKDLVAVHNLSHDKLLKTLKLGGLPMPSIAITRARKGWNNFGEISLVFSKDTIDPEFLRSNKVYSGDAWTPTYPQVEYKLNTKTQEKIKKKIDTLVPRNVQNDLGGLHLDSTNMEYELNRHGDVVAEYRYNSAMKYAFLKDNNVNTELPTTEEPLYRYGQVSNSAVISFAHKMVEGLKTVNSLLEQDSSKLMGDMELINTIATVLNEDVMSTIEENTDAYQRIVKNPLFKPEDIDLSTVLGMLEATRKYFNKNGKIDNKVNYTEARKLIDEKTDMAKYESWLKDLFSDVIAKEGIRNNKDLYTPSGNRRSFEALHYEHNLENVIKAMKEEGTKGIGGFGGGNIFGAATREYGSVDDVKADAENRMQQLPESEYDEIKKGFSDRLFELANSLPIHKDSFADVDDAANMLIKAVSKYKTKSGMANYLRTESKGWANYNDYVVDDLIQLVSEIRQMPVSYFEAKPQRAVGFDEIKAVIMPEQSSYEDDLSEVKGELEKLGVPILEYEYGDNNARLKALNSLEEVRFSTRDDLSTEEDYKANCRELVEMDFVATLVGTELDGNLPLKQRISDLFESWGNSISTERFGNVALTNSSIHSEFRHGTTRNKVTSYAAIPEVLNNGVVIDVWKKNRGEVERIVVAAPISISNIPFFMGVMIQRDSSSNRLYLHDVVIKKEVSEYQAEHLNTTGPVETENLFMTEVLEEAISVGYSVSYQNEDVKFSDRDNTTVYDIMGENDRILKENEKFKAEIERLKERLNLERKVTGGNYFNENQVGVAAGHIRKIANSDIDKVELMKSLKDFYSFIAHSPELVWEDVFERSYRIAEDVLEKSKPIVVGDEYSEMVLRDIRSAKITLSEAQKNEARFRFGKNWNRYFFGNATITDRGISLESQWQEWADMYPDMFDADISETDMVTALYDNINILRDAKEKVIEYETSEQTRWLANEIYNTYWNVSPIRTTADKYDKKIKLLNFEHRRAITEMRDDYNSRLKQQHNTDKEKYKELTRKIRERKDKEIALAKQHGREMLEGYKDRAERKTRIQSITANALSLNELLIKNSKDKHIPEILREPVTALLQAIDFSSKRLLDKGIPTQKDISLSKTLGKVKDMMVKASNAHEELVELYGHGLDEDIEKMVDSVDDIMRTVGDNEFIINRMTLTDLQTLDKMVKTIRHAVNKMNKFHTVNHAKGIANLSQESVLYLDSLGKGKIYDGLRGRTKKLLDWNNALPYYVFKRYGSGGMKVYEALQDGWDKFAFNIKEIIDYANDAYTSKEVDGWSKEVKTFDIVIPANEIELSNKDYEPQYQKVQLTVPQIMSMYCLNKREQARGHLFRGGIRVADFKDSKGKIVSQTDGIIFTEKDISTILNSLTERQREVADKLQEFMNTVCADWGNNVSMARFGYKAFGEENYFPIQSDTNNLAVNDETEQPNSLFKLLNMSFTKSTIENADNRIVISDIFDVFAQHTSDMAKYNSLALPVLDAFKWYNYKERQDIADGTFKTTGVKQSIESAFGKDGQDYFTTFLKDINGSQEVSRDTFGKGFFSNAKIAAVGANLRVMFLQPTSYVRASAVIDNRYLAKALVHKPKVKRAETHCGIALWKSMGYYDTNIQRGVEAQIKHNDTWKDKAVDIAMKGSERADKITWGYLWNACELEVRDKRKDLKVGSEEFYAEIGKRLREVIYATQVVDSTMTRSQMMRSGDGRDKMLTAFASEPTLAFNMLQDAYMQLALDTRRMGSKKEAWKKNGKRVARLVVAYTMTNVLTALVESGFDWLRDDDDEEMDAAAFMKLYLSNFLSDMSISGKIPYIKEIHSVIKGFSSSRSDAQWMEEMTKAITTWFKIFNGKGNATTAIKYSIKAISDLSGLPFYNLYRDSRAVINKLDLFTAEDLNEMFKDYID